LPDDPPSGDLGAWALPVTTALSVPLARSRYQTSGLVFRSSCHTTIASETSGINWLPDPLVTGIGAPVLRSMPLIWMQQLGWLGHACQTTRLPEMAGIHSFQGCADTTVVAPVVRSNREMSTPVVALVLM
jgi:hypothetical protein